MFLATILTVHILLIWFGCLFANTLWSLFIVSFIFMKSQCFISQFGLVLHRITNRSRYDGFSVCVSVTVVVVICFRIFMKCFVTFSYKLLIYFNKYYFVWLVCQKEMLLLLDVMNC